MQTRMAQELHTKAGVPMGPCGIEEAKQFQAYLAEYQIKRRKKGVWRTRKCIHFQSKKLLQGLFA